METYPLLLVLFDFLPTFAFLAGGLYLVRMVRLGRGKSMGWLALAGVLLVFAGGFSKALWKLMVTAASVDLQWLAQVQFVLSAIGFLGLFGAVLSLVRRDGKGGPVLAIASWKIPFLFVMTVASLGAEGILAYLAFKRKVLPAAVGLVLGVLGILGMGALASADQTLAMQWVEETVNTIGQLGFMLGCIFLYRDCKTAGCEKPAGD
ncbi:MAG TPA: hypothetical protein VMC09_04690 [Anaerolineales bacterium]|nr:hypothetical protein [Anaerolineales bacterium]